MPTYKKEYTTLVEDIMTECDIYSVNGRKFHTERAVWDTGADTTIISSRIVKLTSDFCRQMIDETKQLQQWIEGHLPATRPSSSSEDTSES